MKNQQNLLPSTKGKMKIKQPSNSIRLKGQRSIKSTAIFRSETRSSIPGDENADVKAGKGNGHRVSFSEFLNKKLHRNSVLPGFAEGKEKSCLSSAGKNLSSPNGGKGKAKEPDKEEDFTIDVVLQQFKHAEKEEKEIVRSGGDNEPETDGARKRKRVDCVECPKKVVAVLGEGSGAKTLGVEKNAANKDIPKNLFNHYANGRGWWDYNREGVDNEEVGCVEAWEGVCSTTLGGLDWN